MWRWNFFEFLWILVFVVYWWGFAGLALHRMIEDLVGFCFCGRPRKLACRQENVLTSTYVVQDVFLDYCFED